MKKLLLAVLLLPSAAQASPSLDLLIGGFNPVTQIEGVGKDDLAGSGGALGLRLLQKSSRETVSFGGELLLMGSGEHDSTVILANANTTGSFGSVVILGEAKLAATTGTVRPFLILGVGLHATSVKFDATPRPGFAWTDTGTSEKRTLVDDAKAGLAMTAQAGLEIPFTERLSAGLAGGIYNFSERNYEATPQGRSVGFQGLETGIASLSLLANVTYRF